MVIEPTEESLEICGRIRGRVWETSMPLLLWVVLPFAIWSACVNSIVPVPVKATRNRPPEFGGG